MRYITDFHIHSKYSRACSKDLVPENLALWAGYKGIHILGTGDFTHPLWFREIEQKLEPAEEGLFRLKDTFALADASQSGKFSEPRFLLTSEVSSIYSQGGKVRRVHTVLVVSSLEAVRELNRALANIGNLQSDGRPILGVSAKELAKIALSIDPRAIVIPAHIWTPWFAVFGSMSGFDSLEECYDELTPSIFAVETGLSSDPEMNWRLSSLDRVALTSSSDAHSLPNLGREATMFDFAAPSYQAVYDALRDRQNKSLLGTIEFYPEEGKYHHDGHATCKIAWSPEETKAHNYICSVCGKRPTIGVMHRVTALADRPIGVVPANHPESLHIVPLQEIIADAFGQGKATKKVQAEYWKIIHEVGNEFQVLLDIPLAQISKIAHPRVVEGIDRVRRGDLAIHPGYDGVYGVVKVFNEDAQKKSEQSPLF